MRGYLFFKLDGEEHGPIDKDSLKKTI